MSLRHRSSRESQTVIGSYWRSHPNYRPFTEDDAHSAPLDPIGMDRFRWGYSCVEDPWSLWVYVVWMGWLDSAKQGSVYVFDGTKVDEGQDGEPVVMPDFHSARNMSWSDFERECVSTPRPNSPSILNRGGFGYDDWLRTAAEAGRDDLIGQFVMDQAVKDGEGTDREDMFWQLNSSKKSSTDSVFVATFLVSGRDNWSNEDYLGSAVSGFQEGALLSSDCTRGNPTSIKLRFLAPDLSTATQWASEAMRDTARYAFGVDSLVVRPGRRTVYERESGLNGDTPFLTFSLGGDDNNNLVAMVDGRAVANIIWNVGDGEVKLIRVDPKWRRKGIADALFSKAREINPSVHHSDRLTDDGYAWAHRRAAGANGNLPTGIRLEVKPNRRGVLAWLSGDQIKELSESSWATSEEVIVGELNWTPEGMVSWIVVPYEELRRHGIADALWALAKTVNPNIYHSDERSESGDAWSQHAAGFIGNGVVPINNMGGYVARGMAIMDADVSEVPMVNKVLNHTITAQEMVRTWFNGSVGHWWAEDPDWDIVSVMDWAYSATQGSFVATWGVDDFGMAGCGFAVVFVAKQPTSGFEDSSEPGWTYGLRPDGVSLNLVEIWYNCDGNDWYCLPASGLTVTSRIGEGNA